MSKPENKKDDFGASVSIPFPKPPKEKTTHPLNVDRVRDSYHRPAEQGKQ